MLEIFRLTWEWGAEQKNQSVLPISGLLFYKALVQHCGSHNGRSTQQLRAVLLWPRAPRILLSGRAEHPPPRASFIPVPPSSRCLLSPRGTAPPNLQQRLPRFCNTHTPPTPPVRACLTSWSCAGFIALCTLPKNSPGTSQHGRGTAQLPAQLRHPTHPTRARAH